MRKLMRSLWLAVPLVVASPAAPLFGQAAKGSRPDDSRADDDRERTVMERFLAILEKNPRRSTALDRVYGYHVERGTLENMVKTYRDRTAKDPKDGTSWLLLGLFEAQRGRDAAAVEALRKAEQTRPDDPLPSYYLGQALVLVGQPDAAAEAFERAIERKPTRTELLEIFQALGRIHQRAHHMDQALAVWNRLEDLFPNDPRVKEQIAATLAEESEPARALPRYEALAKTATDPYRKVQFRIDAAELKVRLNRQAEALVDFESLLGQLNPDSWLYREVRRRIEEVFLRNDDQAGLATYYESWLKKNAEDVEAMARLGRTLASQGRAADAQKWFDKAVKLAPSRKELRLALVEQLVQEKKFAEAAAQYEAMAKNEPNNPDVIRDWGRMLLRDAAKPDAERKQAAAAVWRKLLESRPDDAAVTVQVADLFRQADMADDAVALYQKAIAQAPDAAQYYEYLGEYFHSLKRADEALATWAKLAEGKNKNAKNLARLAEVLAGFGYTKEALAPSGEACKLDPDAFDTQLKYADLLYQAEKYDAALTQLEAAARAAIDPEQSEAVLDLQVKTYQTAGTLEEKTIGLRNELEAGKNATAERWRRLAKLYEAGQQTPEAVRAIDKSVALDPKSVASWTAYARTHETAGDLGGAVDAYRKLAALDRRALTEYLTAVAKLEVRLGRRDQALKAGREVLAAAPGNPDSYQFFAELCNQLGEVEEGLDTLRRAVRVNPSDIKAITTLGEALAREFRTEEAIELYWRAFAKSPELDAKLSTVGRLTDLYLQRNQFDRLVARLEREGRESKQQRETAICLAQAYASSGDYGTARQELERLLATNSRDTALLQQLSSLSETDGDLTDAAKYQRQLNEIAPSDDAAARLAQLYLRAGETNEAEAIWTRMAGSKQELHRYLLTIDNLLGNDKTQTALGIIDRVLRDHPGHWELLYREGVALAALDKPDEAAKRFRAVLDQRHNDDDESEQVKAAKKAPPGRPAAKRARLAQLATNYPTIPIRDRENSVWEILQATGLQNQYYGYQGQRRLWSPADFGRGRMASLAWLVALARKQGKEEAFLAEQKAAREKAPQDVRKLWDWFYLELIEQEGREIYEAARALSRAARSDPSAQFVYLNSLSQRASSPGQRYYANNDDTIDKTPPLPKDELEHVLACYNSLVAQKPDWAEAGSLSVVSLELKRAKDDQRRDALYREAVAKAKDAISIMSAAGLATERGDLDTFLALVDRYTKLASGQPNSPGIEGLSNLFQQAMLKQNEARKNADVLKLLDRYFDAYTNPEQAALRIRSYNPNPQYSQAVNFQLTIGKQNQWIQLDYPTANRYYDVSAITVLRTAYELYKHDDLLSDLMAHQRERARKEPERSRVYTLMGIGYLDWWNDDKDEAVRELTRAVESVRDDAELRLNLAELRSRRGDHEEALAIVDGVEPLDQKTMQRREILALRLAVLSGNVDRARQAAERLFNLRLDTETQVQLAAQMHQLGMHDLGEAVLARARRRAGNNTNTLVGLMQQYQRQNKMDVAVQVAHQILRRTPSRTFSPYQEDDTSQREAIQVLARSGKLQELIGRVETQLKTSPNSIELLRTLSAYQKAAGNEAKAREALERVAKARPGDATLRYQIAMELLHGGDAAAAIEHFKAAIKKEPNLFGYRYWEIQNAFQQAGKQDELAAIFEDMDVKKLGNFWSVEQLVNNLMQDEKTRQRGLKLFKKMWAAFPNERGSMIASFYNDEVWKLPEMYDYARQAVIPTANQKITGRWTGVDSINSWSGGGHVNGVADRLLSAAARQNKLEALADEIRQGMAKTPEWSGGKVFLAMIQVRRNKYDEARKLIEDLLANDTKEKDPIPHDTRLFLAQEIENYGPFQQIALRLFETADKEDNNNNGLDFEWHPVRKLIAMYRKLGRTEEARDIVLRFAKRPSGNNYDGNYAAYRRVENATALGRELLELGYPADAVPLYGSLLADSETLRAVEQFYGGGSDNYMVTQLRQGLSQAMRGINGKTIAPTVRTLLKPGGGTGGDALSLVLLVNPREMDRAAVTSLFAETTKAAAKTPALLAELKKGLADLSAKNPKDFSVQIAECLTTAAEGNAGRFAEAAGRLAKLADELPLEDVSEGARPNARQRTEAARRLGLWLVARECWKNDATRATGDRLAAHATEAARRQSDPLWILAMLREQGQLDLARGDRAGAERAWTRLLEQVLAKNTPAVAKPDRPARSPRVATPTKGATSTAAATAPRTAASPAPTTTLDRFELATQLAKLAAGHDMTALSLRATRDALRGGPPVVPMPIETSNGGMVSRRSNNNGAAPDDQIMTRVELALGQLSLLWKQHRVAATDVYELLRDVALPAARPSEVFLYPRPLASNPQRPQSVGKILAEWAARAGKADELRARLEARRTEALAELPARVLLAQLDLATRDHGRANASLKALDERLSKDSLETSAVLACHVAVYGLEQPESAPAALALLEHAVKNMSTSSSEEPLGGLHIRLARAQYAAGRPREGRQHILEFQKVLARSMPNYGGDYGLYVRKEHLQRVALEFAREGQWADTLDLLGQFVDAPVYRGGDPGLGNVLARLGREYSTLTPRQRYDQLKAWSLPTANRKSIRLLASYVPRDVPPPIFGKFDNSAFDHGVASTVGMLIQAARELGVLDELAGEAASLANQKVENADALLALVQIQRGQPLSAKPKLLARLAELREYAGKEQHRGRAILWSDVLVARACLRDKALWVELGEPMAVALIQQAQRTQNWPFLSDMRYEFEAFQAARTDGEHVQPGSDPGLAYWHPAEVTTADRHAAGSTPSWWAESESHIRQIGGPENQMLLFDFPVTGTFEFSVDAFIGGWAEGQAGYGGLIFEADSNNVPSGLYEPLKHDNLRLPSKFSMHDAFNRMTVKVEPGKVRYIVNGHLFYEDNDPSPTSPWLMLFSERARETTYRDLRLTGAPEIPRAVPLSHGDRLEGWVAGFFNQSRPPRRSLADNDPRREALASDSVLNDYEWAARDGVIHGKRGESFAGSEPVQGRLYYHRPLRNGDVVSYEFYYESGAVMVHPTLDRVAFLLEPDGVRLHWITDGRDNEWTGLKTSNLADEPANRRGPQRLPLKEKAWNAARVSLKKGTAVLELNGVEIYSRPMEPDNNRQFGFFHFREQTAAQARNVVLQGAWPKSVPAEALANLTARRGTPAAAKADARSRHGLIREETFVESADLVLKKARTLEPAARYDYLAEWVLPSGDWDDFRLQGSYTPVDAAPPVAAPAIDPPDNVAESRIHTGGQPQAPALELVAAARQLGKLDALAERVRKADTSSPHGLRSRVALHALIHMAQKRDTEAQSELQELARMVRATPKDSPMWVRWPEFLAQSTSIGRPRLRNASGDLNWAQLDHWHFMNGNGMYPRDRDLWGHHVMYNIRRAEFLDLPIAQRNERDVSSVLPLWSPVIHASAQSRGTGEPMTRWWVNPDGVIIHGQGHRNDLLYLNVPLRGDFELSCEVQQFGMNQMQVVYGALRIMIRWDRKMAEITRYGVNWREVPIEPPLADLKSWYPLRLVVKNRTYTLFLQDRKIVEDTLPGQPDPWLSLHQMATGNSGLRNLKLTGTPTVPASLELSALPDLAGWLGEYYGERMDGDVAAWKKSGDEIVGTNFAFDTSNLTDRWGNVDTNKLNAAARPGSKQESLLQYHRPMLEDGEMRFEFWYEPGKTTVAPALDRLAFLLEPDGVKIHWLTDAQYDRTGLAPDNVTVEPKNRRGPSTLPLKPQNWNALVLKLTGNVVTLSLNGESVYERPLETTNSRQFGLFHYADETDVRVRNVIYEGRWPRALPADFARTH